MALLLILTSSLNNLLCAQTLCWKTNSTTNKKADTFLTYVGDNFLFQKIEVATRGSAILDLFLTNRGELIEEIKVVGNLGASDYMRLEFSILTKSLVKDRQTVTMDFRKADFNKFRNFIRMVPWENVTGKGIVAGWDFLKIKLQIAWTQTILVRKKTAQKAYVVKRTDCKTVEIKEEGLLEVEGKANR